MSSSRRLSKQSDTSSEFFLECKAAFLSIYDDISDKIESKKRLNNVLQQSGRNPTRAALDKYWPKNTEELSFTDFVDICRKEPVTTADDLMKAFRKIDMNGDGYISLDELYKIMNAQGENMSREDVRKMIDEVDENKDGKLDYGEMHSGRPVIWRDKIFYDQFTNMIMKTTEESRKFSMKVMEKKERKKRRGEKHHDTATVTDSEKLNFQTPEINKNDCPSENVDESDHSNRISESCSNETVPSNTVKQSSESPGLSKSTLEDSGPAEFETEEDKFGSIVSVRSKRGDGLGGSVSSFRSHGKGENKGSLVSVRTLQEDPVGSQVSVRVTGDLGSKTSLKSKNTNKGSQVSLRQASMGSRSSVKPIKMDKMGSQSSLRSVKELEITTQTKGADVDKLGSESHAVRHHYHERDGQSESPKKESPKASPRSRSDSAGKSSLKKGTAPKEHAQKDSGTKETPRRESKAKNDKPPLPESPKSKDSSADKSKSKVETPKTGSNSARSVGEEIDYDDDFDIVSTGRPTPRVDLKSQETPKEKDTDKKEATKRENNEKTESKSKTKKDEKESSKDAKGNTSDKAVDSHAIVSTANEGKNKSNETKPVENQELKKIEEGDRKTNKGESKEQPNHEDSGAIRHQTDSQQTEDKTEARHLTKDYKPRNDLEEKSPNENTKSSKKTSDDRIKNPTSFVDEIFKSGRNTSTLLAREFDMILHEGATDEQSKKDDTDKNSKDNKAGRIQETTPKVPPRKDRKGAENATRNNENSLGSQTSLKSGDKEISAPVPSPRKSVSRLSEEDVPRPSPRVTKGGTKGRPHATRTSELPDPKTFHDWLHYTSKGCFFYEDDEIVTHVYSLKLTEDSSVYLSAYPIQEPACLNLPGAEPVDTPLFIFDNRGKLVVCTEQRDTKGTYGVRCELNAGEYQVLPYTTGCRFRKRLEESQDNMKEAKLVKTRDDKVVITSAFRRALEDIFDLCDLDNNGTMSRDEFNWFNLRTSGEELGEDEWEVVEEKTDLENGEITKKGFIELNEMEAEDAQGDVEDLWITLTSMGMNKGLIMDEACPFRIDVYVEESGRKKPSFKVAGIESLEKKEYVSEICQYTIERADEPLKIRNMKDLYMYTYKNEYRATIVIDNRSRSNVTLQVNCNRSKNVVSNRPSTDHTLEVDPESTAIAHHLLPKNELSEWTISCTETIKK